MGPRSVVPLVLALLACALLAPAVSASMAPGGVTRPGGPGGLGGVAASPGAPAGKPAVQRPVQPAKGTLTLLYGDDHVFGIVPPPGWVVDDSSGLGAKIRVVLYPRGQKWSSAPTVMYTNPLHQDPKARRTFAQMIARDVDDFHKHAPHGTVVSAPGVRNVRGQQAEVRYFSPDGHEPLSAVAYYEEASMVMLLVLESKTAEGFRAALPAFNSMVASYQFVVGDLQTPTNVHRGGKR